MTKNNNREKLTLKLKLPKSADPKILALKSAENKRINNSKVQISVKNRKSVTAKKAEESSESSKLNLKELESRKLAINESFEQEKDYNVLSKIRENKEQEQKILEEEAQLAQEKENNNIKNQEEDTIDEKPPIFNDYKVDSLDIRNKIKNSVNIEKIKEEERQKAIAQRKAAEAEKLAEQKRQNEKNSKNKRSYDSDGETTNKKKTDFKEKRKSGRRLLQTFIVDDEEEGRYSSRYRKKAKIKDEAPKEYAKVIKDVTIPELISVSDLSDRMSEKTGDVVKKLFNMGVVATSNQVIDADTAQLIVEEFGHKCKRVQESDVENILESDGTDNIEKVERGPVVTIMGHVDHGKTSLLDAIKSTNIAGKESGGITQHIGASRIKTKSGKFITFLDTPGHEAFTEMRLRGANATDIVILVVAADDGIKEQTIEAINHARAANVPIIVAINKIDKPGADVDRVKNELLAQEIVAEELGGDSIFVEVSAKTKTNLNSLEEAILLQSEILELKSPYDCKASGVIIESRVDSGKGVIATLLVQKGTLNVSDIVVAGTSYGKIKKMIDDKGKSLKSATPSMPVEILGLDKSPKAGDTFSVVTEEKQARDIISYRSKKEKDEKFLKNSAKSIDDIFKEASSGSIKYLPIIIKGDVHGSVEAINTSLTKLNTDEVAIKVMHSATGGVTESDINLAEVAGAIIIAFNVRASNLAKELAAEKNIDIRYHSIIYNVVDEIKLLLGGMLDPIKNEEHLGQAEVRQVFKVSGVGTIAGCFVISGIIKRGAKARLLRDNVVIYDGELKTLKRFKDDVKEVKNNFECGCALERYDDLKEGDVIECYEIIEQNRTI